jgi:hypothetical protein
MLVSCAFVLYPFPNVAEQCAYELITKAALRQSQSASAQKVALGRHVSGNNF